MSWGSDGDAKCRKSCNGPTYNQCRLDLRDKCAEECSATCLCNVATPAPTPYVPPAPASSDEIRTLMAQKFGLSLNGRANSNTSTFTAFENKRFGNCHVL